MVRPSHFSIIYRSCIVFESIGDICYVEALGNKFILLGSWQRTSDIFDKRGAYYSDRALLPMLDL